MNFLGHLYFSENNPELMYANLFGDFVKGKDLSEYTSIVQQGIRLHREIDSYIDNHPIIKELLHHLYPSLPKIAGIAIDLYFDHLLAKNWKNYSAISLGNFIQTFENHSIDEVNYPDENFHFMLFRMKKSQWLIHYASLDGLEHACRGVSQRISFPNTLFNGRTVFEENEQLISEAFKLFMNEAQQHFKNYFRTQDHSLNC